MRLSMSAEIPRPTASGLMIAKVRSIAKRFFLRSNFVAVDNLSFARFGGLLADFFFAADFWFCARLRFRFRTHHTRDCFADVSGALDGVNSGGSHRFVLFHGRAVPAADDRAGVTHAAARRRGLSGDESDDRLLHMLLDELRRNFFGVAADFADHHDRVRVGIVVEHANRIEKAGADDRIAADADARRLPDAELRELADRFVRQRAAAADDADISLLVNRCRA